MKGSIKQVCIIVKDQSVSMKDYWEKFGIGAFQKNHFTPETSHDLWVKGKEVNEPYHFCCACCWEGGMEYELIQPFEGPNIYWDHLAQFGPGLHHFKVVIHDNDELKAYVDSLQEKGMPVTQTGWLDNDVHYYVDSYDKLGMILELGNGGSIRATEDIYPAEENPQRLVAHVQNIAQIGLVVDDIEKYKKNWTEIMGITEWTVKHCTPATMDSYTYKGEKPEDFEYITATAMVDSLELELIQPVKGPSVYADFLKKHGNGLHHLTDICPKEQIDEVVARVAADGIGVTQEGAAGDTYYCCLDTENMLSMVLKMQTNN